MKAQQLMRGRQGTNELSNASAFRSPLLMNETVTQVRDTTANPAPLGLLGFGMTTVLLNLHDAASSSSTA